MDDADHLGGDVLVYVVGDGGAVALGMPAGETDGVLVAQGLVHGGDDDEDRVALLPFADAGLLAEHERQRQYDAQDKQDGQIADHGEPERTPRRPRCPARTPRTVGGGCRMVAREQ